VIIAFLLVPVLESPPYHRCMPVAIVSIKMCLSAIDISVEVNTKEHER